MSRLIGIPRLAQETTHLVADRSRVNGLEGMTVIERRTALIGHLGDYPNDEPAMRCGNCLSADIKPGIESKTCGQCLMTIRAQ